MLAAATSRTTSFLAGTYSTTSLYPPGELQSEYTKIAISRIRRESDVGKTTAEGPRPPRTNHACELCRQKRTKCPGERPFCSKCQNLNLVCVYPDTKRVEEKRSDGGVHPYNFRC